MSKENFIEFYTKYVNPDADLKARLAKAASEDEFMEILAPKASEAGVEFTMQDIRETVVGELKFVLESLSGGDTAPLQHRDKFFNPLGSRIFSMGSDMGTCHC
jgi:hypothetical protein